MKKISVSLIVFFLIIASSSFNTLNAQEKTKEERERELRIQEEIEAQKKAISEQKNDQVEITNDQEEITNEQETDLQKEMELAKKDIREATREARDKADEAIRNTEMQRIYRGNGNRSFPNEPFNFSPMGDNFFGNMARGDSERTSWDFSKSIKENSFSGNYSFEVESTVSNVVMAVNGACKAGDIRIKILTPNGKVYSDIVIDEFGDLNWRKSFNISDTENKDKAGSWKFQINASKATGYFKISLRTY